MSDADGGTAHDPSDAGWTNEYVRSGYEVDGSVNRVNTLPKEWALRLHKTMYELIGAFFYRRVICNVDRWFEYPVRRVIWRLLDDEATAEQAIAESEYVKTIVLESDRRGIGSIYWLLGVGLAASAVLIGAGFGWSAFFIADFGLEALYPASIGFLTTLGGFSTAAMAYVAYNQLPSLEGSQ